MMVAPILAVQKGREPEFLRAVRLRARRRVLWLRHWWSSSPQPSMQGLAIPDSDVDRFLRDPDETRREEIHFYRANAEAAALTRASAEAEAKSEPRWRRLVEACSLSPEEAALLALALAVEADPWWRRVCGYLHDDSTAQYASPWLAASLAGPNEEWSYSPPGALLRWRLARPLDAGGGRTVGWQANPGLLAELLAEAQDVAPPAFPQCLYPDELAAMTAFVRRVQAAGSPVQIEIVAPPGAGRFALAQQLARALEAPLETADAGGPPNADRLMGSARRARIDGALLCLRNADAADPALWPELCGAAPLTLFCAARRLDWPASLGAVESVVLPPLRAAERSLLWHSLTGSAAPPEIAESSLLPAEIATAAGLRHLGAGALSQTCHALLYRSPGELFTELPLAYCREDLVVPPALRAHLDELEAHARHRHAVLEEWEFRRLSPLGQGLTALFAGPSGTGKTMAAQVLAQSLGLGLRRVDLSAVVNKYVGETEKRLKLVFDSCERSPSILFFDEADALFGNRTQVKDAHDRFANIEINYLLQRMEQFNGLAILATNRKDDLDKAFLRRLRFLVDFPTPAPKERREIWRRSLPETTSLGLPLLAEPLDFDLLANRLELTGAAIKSAALGAAFLAREEGALIGMRHVIAAARRELSKLGHVLRPGDLEA